MESKELDKVNLKRENPPGTVTTVEFLDFLKLACSVHESIILKNGNGHVLDYNAIAKNEIINSLLSNKSGQSPKSNGLDDNGNSSEKNGEYLLACGYNLSPIDNL